MLFLAPNKTERGQTRQRAPTVKRPGSSSMSSSKKELDFSPPKAVGATLRRSQRAQASLSGAVKERKKCRVSVFFDLVKSYHSLSLFRVVGIFSLAFYLLRFS